MQQLYQNTVERGAGFLKDTSTNLVLLVFVVLLLIQVVFGIRYCILECVNVFRSGIALTRDSFSNSPPTTSSVEHFTTQPPKLVFYHIPRTGGTTIVNHLKYLLYRLVDASPSGQLVDHPPIDHPPIDQIVDHLIVRQEQFNLHHHPSDAHAIIAFRDPVELKLSEYHATNRTNKHGSTEDFVQSTHSLEDFVKKPSNQNTMTKLLLDNPTTPIGEADFNQLMATLDRIRESQTGTFLITEYLEDTIEMFENKYSMQLDENNKSIFCYKESHRLHAEDYSPEFIRLINHLNRYDRRLYQHILQLLPIQQHRQQRPKSVQYILPRDIPDGPIDPEFVQMAQHTQQGGTQLTNDGVQVNTDAPMTEERKELSRQYDEFEKDVQDKYMDELNSQVDQLVSREVHLVLSITHYCFPLYLYCPVAEFYTEYASLLKTVNKPVSQLKYPVSNTEAIAVWLHAFQTHLKDSTDVLLMRLRDAASCHETALQKCTPTSTVRMIATLINLYYHQTNHLHQQLSLTLRNVPEVCNEIEFHHALQNIV